MQEQNVFQYLKAAYRRSGVIGKFIALNTLVFLFFSSLFMFEKLFLIENLENNVKIWFSAPGDPADLIYKPWSIVTQLFTHGGFAHFAFNMIAFYFTGRIFVQFFGERRLVLTYFLAGIFAYIFHVGCYYVIPAFQQNVVPGLIGASGAIMAIFMAISIHRPGYRVYLYGVLKVPLIVLALLYIIYDLRGVTTPDGIAHLAHLGGALFGAISVVNINSSRNFMNRFDRWFSKFKWPKLSFKRKPKMKVYKQEDYQQMDDDKYRSAKKDNQARVDGILDKISKKGYEGLTKEEKEILFNESKRK
jgi:membrane associated rhomboid family serine protease